MKKILQYILKKKALKIIEQRNPFIIAITGSVGKTSAKEAVYSVAAKKASIRKSDKNYNNEIGLPLTIIGQASAGKNIGGWLSVFKKAEEAAGSDSDYPEMLVLELGADRPGDIGYLTRIIKPDIAVITAIGESHLEYFDSVDQIKKEKLSLAKELKSDGRAILNYDDLRIRSGLKEIKSGKLTYGFDEGADLRAIEMQNNFEVKPDGDVTEALSVSFKLKWDGSVVPVRISGCLGKPAVYAALAGAAVGIALDMNLVEISQALSDVRPPKGRMNSVYGIKGSVIIDDTYNASPQSCIEALDALSSVGGKRNRKIAVFGDMLELGSYTEEGHKAVGRKVFEAGIDHLYVVGERAMLIAQEAKKRGMPEDCVYHFSDNHGCGLFLQERIKKGDIILVKGSQGARMEKIVKEIMAEPLKAPDLLVRQDAQWI